MPEWTVSETDSGERVDRFISQAMNVSRGESQRLLESGAATVNLQIAKPNHRLRAGDSVSAVPVTPTPTRAVAESIPLKIVYEDEHLLVIDKPRGMVVHPAPGARSGTLVNAVLAHANDLSGIGGELRPGIVHRLDKDTSGLLVVAKNDAAHLSLQKQIQAKSAERRYEAVIWGVPKFQHVEIDAPVGRNPTDRKKMAVLADSRHRSREAVTELTVKCALGPFSLAEARLRTGRTHQIRVHCAWMGHPVVGDLVYGGMRRVPAQGIKQADRERVELAIKALKGQALHAFHLSFDHPKTGERLTLETPMPPVMQELVDLLKEVWQ